MVLKAVNYVAIASHTVISSSSNKTLHAWMKWYNCISYSYIDTRAYDRV